jgi:hypothetical protein
MIQGQENQTPTGEQSMQPQNNEAMQFPKKGFIGRLADTWKENNLGGKIGNAAVHLGSAAQTFVHGATGGRYGAAFGDTLAGIKQQQNYQTGERQGAEQHQIGVQNLQHTQGLEMLGQQQGFQADQAGLDRQQQTSERTGTQQFQTGERVGTQNFQAEQERLNRELQRALQANDHAQAKEILDTQLAFTADQAGLDREQQQALIRLSAEMTVEQQREMNNLLLSYTPDQVNKFAKWSKAQKGVTTADDALIKARSIADTANVIATTAHTIARTINPLGHAQGSNPVSTADPFAAMAGGNSGRADGGYTGKGDKYESAGIVHKGEYVIPKKDVDQSTGMPKPTWKPKPFWHKNREPSTLTREQKLAQLKKWG